MTTGIKYQVEVVKTGDGATQAADQLKRLGQEFDKAKNSAAAANTAFTQFDRQSVQTLHKNGRALSGAMNVLSMSGFQGAATNALGLRMAIDAVKDSASALGWTVGRTAAGLGLLAIGATLAKETIVAAYDAVIAKSILARTKIESITQANNLRGALEKDLKSLMGDPNSMTSALELWDEFYAKNQAGTDRPSALKDISTQTAGLKFLQEFRGVMDKIEASKFDDRLALINRQFDDLYVTVNQSGAPLRDVASVLERLEGLRTDALTKVKQELYDMAASVRGDLLLRSVDGVTKSRLQLSMQLGEDIRKIQELKRLAAVTDEEFKQMMDSASKAYAVQSAALEKTLGDLEKKSNKVGAMLDKIQEDFADGFAESFNEVVSGTKTVGDAFRELFSDILKEASKMLISESILSALKSIGSYSGNRGTSFSADGGIYMPRMMAAGGMVSSSTYFPRFNVVAGEAGSEFLTVLSRPRMMNVGGIQAAVGNAGPNRLALTREDELNRLAQGGGGIALIQVRPAPGFEAEIVSQAIRGAKVEVVNDMKRDSKLSRSVRSMP